MNPESVWCQTGTILDFLASRIIRSKFLLLTLQFVVFCNGNINQTEANPSPTVSQSKTCLLEIYPGAQHENRRKENWLGRRESAPESLPLLAIGPRGELYLGFHGAPDIHGSRNNNHTKILDRQYPNQICRSQTVWESRRLILSKDRLISAVVKHPGFLISFSMFPSC